jgi:hypothetical protein
MVSTIVSAGTDIPVCPWCGSSDPSLLDSEEIARRIIYDRKSFMTCRKCAREFHIDVTVGDHLFTTMKQWAHQSRSVGACR